MFLAFCQFAILAIPQKKHASQSSFPYHPISSITQVGTNPCFTTPGLVPNRIRKSPTTKKNQVWIFFCATFVLVRPSVHVCDLRLLWRKQIDYLRPHVWKETIIMHGRKQSCGAPLSLGHLRSSKTTQWGWPLILVFPAYRPEIKKWLLLENISGAK